MGRARWCRSDIYIYIYIYIYITTTKRPRLAGEEHDGVGGVHVGHVVGKHADADLGIVLYHIMGIILYYIILYAIIIIVVVVAGVHVGHVVGEHADADLGIVSHYIIRHYCHCVAVVVVLYAYNLLRDELAVDGGALGPQ